MFFCPFFYMSVTNHIILYCNVSLISFVFFFCTLTAGDLCPFTTKALDGSATLPNAPCWCTCTGPPPPDQGTAQKRASAAKSCASIWMFTCRLKFGHVCACACVCFFLMEKAEGEKCQREREKINKNNGVILHTSEMLTFKE